MPGGNASPWLLAGLVGLGGLLGTLLRMGVYLLLPASGRGGAAAGWPWATLTVNMIGCLGFGLVLGWIESREAPSPLLRAALLTGFMGAFTTFSTFAADVAMLSRAGAWGSVIGYVMTQNVAGLALLWLGLAIASRT